MLWQRVQPQTQIPERHIAPHVTNVLLARSVEFPDVVKVLFHGRMVGHGFDDRRSPEADVDEEECDPAGRIVCKQLIGSFHDDHARHSASRAIRSEKCLEGDGLFDVAERHPTHETRFVFRDTRLTTLRSSRRTEMLRLIREDEPSKPSTRLSTDESLPSLAAVRQTEPRKLTALLRGELDWVSGPY